MAHYAFLDTNNRVTEVIVGVQETELIDGKTPEEFYSTFRNQTCVRTSYNDNIRKQYAGVGYTYDADLDVLSPTTVSFVDFDENHDWQPPTPMPVEEGKEYAWFEPNQVWIELV
jgi:exonuclease III